MPPLRGRPFRDEDRLVTVRSTSLTLWSVQRPWTSLRAGTGHAPFNVAVAPPTSTRIRFDPPFWFPRAVTSPTGSTGEEQDTHN